MNELINLESDIQFKPAQVSFPSFEEMKENALALADRISQVEVTEENIKNVKKDLAQVRKLVTELNNRRKLIKSEILKDYNIFESQIKEIDGIVTDAENIVRQQVKEIEDAERSSKRDAIRQIWDKRIGQYSFSGYGDYFDKWLQPSHLNKTASMKSVEDDMIRWLEDRQKDYDSMSLMEDGDYLVEYLRCLDINEAMQTVLQRKAIQSVMKPEETEETATFIITGKKDISLTEALLKENEIEYRRIK